MDISSWKEKIKNTIAGLDLRHPWEDPEDEDDWEDFDLKDDYITGAENAGGDLTEEFVLSRPVLIAVTAVLILAALIAYHVFSRRHLYTSYSVVRSYESDDISGTMYERLGSVYVKYGSDGLFVVNAKNETIWSVAYTIQSPIAAVCGETMAIAEQQGSQVVVLDKDGEIGTYTTDLPIIGVSVSENGVTLLRLRDGDAMRLRMYATDGSTIAEIKTTLEDTGYPLAAAMNDDATHVMLSCVRIGDGEVDSRILFYDFRKAQQADSEHMTVAYDYADMVFPTLYYTDGNVPVAVGSDGFAVFTTGAAPDEKEFVAVEEEIRSTFYDDDYVGFIFDSEDTTLRYRMEVYRLNGRQTMSEDFDASYTDVCMDGGEILLWDEGNCQAWTVKGIQRLKTATDVKVSRFFKVAGFRQYLIVSESGMTFIKAE